MTTETNSLQPRKIPKYSVSKKFYGSFDIDEDFLQKIHHLVDKICTSTKITFDLGSTQTVEFEEIKLAIEDATISSNKIESITITGHDYKSEPTTIVIVQIKPSSYCSIQFTAQGDKDVISKIKTDVELIINANRSQFDFISWRRYVKGAGIYYEFLKFVIFLILIAIVTLAFFKLIPRYFADLATYSIWAWWIFVLVSGTIAPPLIFNIGINAKKRQRKVWILALIFGGIILSIAINILSSALYDALKR
ncbi:hypothetical protein ACMDCR_22130 [Labrys okinawensis]|uniref:hypothetical protein n=1 Tax=Labrys okinawensis TaxID=346911 RepID=UPI0039BD5BEA